MHLADALTLYKRLGVDVDRPLDRRTLQVLDGSGRRRVERGEVSRGLGHRPAEQRDQEGAAPDGGIISTPRQRSGLVPVV